MLTLVGIGMVFFMALVLVIVWRWGAMPLRGRIPVSKLVFIAILFTSGLDVGLIMFPLTEFPVYENLKENSEYAFANPLAIEFGFWGFLVWAIYFVTCFYFCALEPKLRFFEITWVKWINNIVIIGTCAFTAHLLFANLSWYLPALAPASSFPWLFAGLVTLTICAAVYSSTELRFVKVLSVSSGALFFALIITLGVYVVAQPNVEATDYFNTLPLLGDYFTHLQRFIFPVNDYHGFYLFWWFSWSIMIGQFTARFVGNIKTVTLLVNMLIWPSLSLGLWFSVLYLLHTKGIDTGGWINRVMVGVGVVFVVNSLDSLIRLYSDNLNLTVSRLGKSRYFALHAFLMIGLTVLFSLEFIRIQWVGALVIGIGLCSVIYAIAFKDKRAQLPPANRLV